MMRQSALVLVLVGLLFLSLQALVYWILPRVARRNSCNHCNHGVQKVVIPGQPSSILQSTSLQKGRRPVELSSERAKAAIVILARNSDIDGLKKSISMLEKRFNARFGYPYVFLNDSVFTEQFKTEMRKLTNSTLEFGLIPKEHWSYPSWINVTQADAARADMEKRRVIYGGSLSYRHMCRYNSGFFFRHPLLDKYEFYWRVEPHVEFFCDIEYDPFLFMKKTGKKYGFVIMLHEYGETIPTLWKTVKEFMKENTALLPEKNALKLIQRENGDYNGCHFWSNFEIASLEFLRSERYIKFFEHLDHAGGFFYERWGDAPVHSIGAAMLLNMSEIHYFEDIGYYHGPFFNCPAGPTLQMNCDCDWTKTVNYHHECYRIYSKIHYEG